MLELKACTTIPKSNRILVHSHFSGAIVCIVNFRLFLNGSFGLAVNGAEMVRKSREVFPSFSASPNWHCVSLRTTQLLCLLLLFVCHGSCAAEVPASQWQCGCLLYKHTIITVASLLPSLYLSAHAWFLLSLGVLLWLTFDAMCVFLARWRVE